MFKHFEIIFLCILIIITSGFIFETKLAFIPLAPMVLLMIAIIDEKLRDYYTYKKRLKEYSIGSPEYEKIRYYYKNKIGYNPDTLKPSALYNHVGDFHGTDY